MHKRLNIRCLDNVLDLEELQTLYVYVKSSIGRISCLRDKDRNKWWGSGFFISEDGLIATAHHVIGNGLDLVFTVEDGREYTVDVVADEPHSDLTILKVRNAASERFTALPLEQTGKLQASSFCTALGYPYAHHKQIIVSPGTYVESHTTELSLFRSRHIFQMRGVDGQSGGPILCGKEVVAVVSERHDFPDSPLPGIEAPPSTDLLSLLQAAR